MLSSLTETEQAASYFTLRRSPKDCCLLRLIIKQGEHLPNSCPQGLEGGTWAARQQAAWREAQLESARGLQGWKAERRLGIMGMGQTERLGPVVARRQGGHTVSLHCFSHLYNGCPWTKGHCMFTTGLYLGSCAHSYRRFFWGWLVCLFLRDLTESISLLQVFSSHWWPLSAFPSEVSFAVL